MSVEILEAAVQIYGNADESYLKPSRPQPGTTFLGFTGTVERLQDSPASPGADLDFKLVGSNGQTYDAVVLGIRPPAEYPANISEMYAPASAQFADVQVVPEGVSGAQVMVTMRDTDERVYFGTTPHTR